jgi:hypothetical protein
VFWQEVAAALIVPSPHMAADSLPGCGKAGLQTEEIYDVTTALPPQMRSAYQRRLIDRLEFCFSVC